MQEVYLQTSCISTGLFASCQQTVTSRTLSGLLFYPNTGTNLYHLLVEFFFIAFFLHSDFSIEGRFYNGLNIYNRMWLQFVFPLPIWIIAGLTILASHFSWPFGYTIYKVTCLHHVNHQKRDKRTLTCTHSDYHYKVYDNVVLYFSAFRSIPQHLIRSSTTAHEQLSSPTLLLRKYNYYATLCSFCPHT